MQFEARYDQSRVALLLIALGVCGILIFGLWPFGRPHNDVSWLANQHAVRFGKRGTIFGRAPLTPSSSGACSIEIWLRPERGAGDGTLLAFYGEGGSDSLSLHQSLTDFVVKAGTSAIYIGDVFKAGRLVFVTLVSDSVGASVYVDGTSVRQISAQNFQFACGGSFVVGDSPHQNNSWQGELHALAIYQHALTAEQAKADYRSWTDHGTSYDHNGTLYLFNEGAGGFVRDQGTTGIDMKIPERYTVVRQILLETPWSAFEPTWGYVQDILINLGGFVPFGFVVAAYFSIKARGRRLIMIVVLFGFLLSLTIESLQSWLPTRDSDLTDVITNTIGTWLGAILSRRWLPRLLAGC